MKTTQEFLSLIKENPTLRIVPIVSSNVVCDDSYNRWIGSFGASYIDEICEPDDAERIYFKSYVDELQEFFEMLYDEVYPEMSNEEFDKFIQNKINEQAWEKVIVVCIDEI